MQTETPEVPTTTEMKAWQHGHPLEYLKYLETFFKHWNSYSVSPFSAIKKNTIASHLFGEQVVKVEATELGKFDIDLEVKALIITTITNSSGPIKSYSNGAVIGNKLKGDRIIYAIGIDPINVEAYHLAKLKIDAWTESIWAYCFAEDNQLNELYRECGFEKVGAKFSSFAEIFHVWYRERSPSPTFGDRQHPKIAPIEKIGVARVKFGVPPEFIDSVTKKLEKLEFANHYSNYNAKNSWSAISLRGYFDDPKRIEKPLEMNDKYLLANPGALDAKLRDTVAYNDFPEIRDIVNCFSYAANTNPHRIRLMKLNPGGGELERHSDLTDPEMGTKPGQLMRIHYPIVTNPDVLFTSWNESFIQGQTVNMTPGSSWYLAIVKPHMAKNGGTTPRIHLVVDYISTPELHAMVDI